MIMWLLVFMVSGEPDITAMAFHSMTACQASGDELREIVRSTEPDRAASMTWRCEKVLEAAR